MCLRCSGLGKERKKEGRKEGRKRNFFYILQSTNVSIAKYCVKGMLSEQKTGVRYNTRVTLPTGAGIILNQLVAIRSNVAR